MRDLIFYSFKSLFLYDTFYMIKSDGRYFVESVSIMYWVIHVNLSLKVLVLD